ncbi:conserved hypothetical protein [Trichinella spiralis]|uniref:hypothetical protein n=1 Tax=Trichinella spiralis TaxID=6334 RepID=UPI0001EFE5B6|nr:conserved hypothetical protein [Trichinella spiralis]
MKNQVIRPSPKRPTHITTNPHVSSLPCDDNQVSDTVLYFNRSTALTLHTKTVAYEQLEWRLRESKIPSTKIEEEFSHHCVRNLVVHDSKQVGLPDERTVDRGSKESGRVWNILWQRESTLSPSLTRKCCAVDVH